MKKYLPIGLGAITVAIAFTLLGMSVGISITEKHTFISCTVDEQQLAVTAREKEISDQIEAKIELLSTLRKKAGELKVRLQSLEFETTQAEDKLLLVRVELANTERALNVVRMEYLETVRHPSRKTF